MVTIMSNMVLISSNFVLFSIYSVELPHDIVLLFTNVGCSVPPYVLMLRLEILVNWKSWNTDFLGFLSLMRRRKSQEILLSWKLDFAKTIQKIRSCKYCILIFFDFCDLVFNGKELILGQIYVVRILILILFFFFSLFKFSAIL